MIHVLGYVMIAIGAVIIGFRLMRKSMFSAIDPTEYPSRTSLEEQNRHALYRFFQIYREDFPALKKDLAARTLAFATGLVVIGLVVALFA